MVSRHRTIVSPISLREVYAQPGEYTAKMLIDPSVSLMIDSVATEIRDSDGLPMRFSSRRWGTKLTLSFEIDSSTPDGVSIIDLRLRKRSGPVVRERFSFWVFK